MLSAGQWNPYYRPAWRSGAAELRDRGIDLYITGVLPPGGQSYFRDIPWSSSKVYEASTDNQMESYMPEMIRQIAFGGLCLLSRLLVSFVKYQNTKTGNVARVFETIDIVPAQYNHVASSLISEGYVISNN